ncbi:MAG TPA: protein-L-isoaspartate(D-aspartate) O-methyltransferase [Thermoanaerobaculia bacterium]|nr:protein-L-isoaspartate(D-aspartate) O-methyltransferase [Thermoanaerobaculia bacterium]
MRRAGLLAAALLLVVAVACSSTGEGERRTGSASADVMTGTDAWAPVRHNMVERQIRARGLDDQAVLDAMEKVPRHLFVPRPLHRFAYADRPLPIGDGQTISQPYVVALMSDLLELDADDRVLEVGTGSGYHAAVMAQLAAEVYSIEILPSLAVGAETVLSRLGYDNVRVRVGDGYCGWPELAPFDAVILTAAPPSIPRPLLDQLAVGGRLVAPVGEEGARQELLLIVRQPDGYTQKRVSYVHFVPMTGQAERRFTPQDGDGLQSCASDVPAEGRR